MNIHMLRESLLINVNYFNSHRDENVIAIVIIIELYRNVPHVNSRVFICVATIVAQIHLFEHNFLAILH